MGGASLHDREIEVEQSRAKLTQDLAILCSAKTFPRSPMTSKKKPSIQEMPCGKK